MDVDPTSDALIQRMDDVHARIAASHVELLALIAAAHEAEAWVGTGARDMAHFVSLRYGISWWKADRWITAAHALEGLPRVSRALGSGELSIDKVVELCRFATAQTEAGLLGWAQRVSSGAIRRRGDVELRRRRQEAEQVDRDRYLRYSFEDEGRRFRLEAELSAPEGAAVAGAIERLASQIPVMPGEEEPSYAECRRADALVTLCAGGGSADVDATVVVHAPMEVLSSSDRSCELEGGGIAHAETVRRLLCGSRVLPVLEDGGRNAIAAGRASRDPSTFMMRQLRYRDAECRFPGCGSRRFTQAHHITWWSQGGRTDLDNLVLVCSFHHKLVHEYGWSLARDPDDTVRWYRPDGTRHRAGPAPPIRTETPQLALAAVGVTP